MKHFLTLIMALLAGSALAQNAATQGNGDNDSALQQLSPPQRAGRRGGVFVLGSTNPYSLGLSNTVGATGSNVRTNTGSGSSSNRASIVVTNNGVVSTNVITNVPPGEIVFPPPVLPGPVPPGPGTTAPPAPNPGTGIRGNPTIVLPPAGAVTPPGPITPPPGPPPPTGEAGVPPGGTAAPPQGMPTPPPPIAAPPPAPRR